MIGRQIPLALLLGIVVTFALPAVATPGDAGPLAAAQTDSSPANDQQGGHGEAEGGPLLRFVGRTHVLLVHFPIALLLAACLAELLRAVRPGWARLQPAARWCLWLGALGAVAAVATGWINEEVNGFDEDQVMWHKILALGAAVTAVLALLLYEIARGRSGKGPLAVARILLLLLIPLIAAAGHTGGALVFGDDYLANAWAGPPAFPQPGAGEDPAPADPAFTHDVVGLFQTYCVGCHAGANPPKGVHLEAIREPADLRNSPELTREIIEMLAEKRMPPPSERQPADGARQAALDWLRGQPLTNAPANPGNAAPPAQ